MRRRRRRLAIILKTKPLQKTDGFCAAARAVTAIYGRMNSEDNSIGWDSPITRDFSLCFVLEISTNTYPYHCLSLRKGWLLCPRSLIISMVRVPIGNRDFLSSNSGSRQGSLHAMVSYLAYGDAGLFYGAHTTQHPVFQKSTKSYLTCKHDLHTVPGQKILIIVNLYRKMNSDVESGRKERGTDSLPR